MKKLIFIILCLISVLFGCNRTDKKPYFHYGDIVFTSFGVFYDNVCGFGKVVQYFEDDETYSIAPINSHECPLEHVFKKEEDLILLNRYKK